MFSKKGITPVIAIVLLLMLTVASAAGAYYWITSMQSGLQENAEGTIGSASMGGEYSITTLSGGIDCDSTSDEITVFVRNQGTLSIPSGTWYAFVKNTNGTETGTWDNTTLGSVSSSSVKKIIFDSSSSMASGTKYSVVISSPKATTVTVTCTAG